MVDFLDKVKQRIDKGFSIVTIKSREVMEVAKKKNQINLLQNQQKNAVFELGEAVFQMYLQNGFNEEKVRTRCEIIALLGSQAREKETELRQLHVKAEEALGKSFCTFCDQELLPSAVYCSRCGERIEEKSKLH